MKVIRILSLTVEPNAGGVENHILEVYKRLQDKGWKVQVYTTNFKKSQNLFSVLNKVYDGVKVKQLHYVFMKLLWLNPLWWVSIAKGEIIEFQNFMPLPGYFVCAITIFLRAIGMKRYSLVLASHGWWETNLEIQASWFKVVRRKFNLIFAIPIINLAFDRAKVVNQIEKDLLIKLGLTRVVIDVIPNGISDEAFEYNGEFDEELKKYGDYIVQFSRIAKIKNVETPILALPDLPDNINLVVAGGVFDEGYRKEIDDIVASHHLQNRVHFVGRISGSKKFAYLKNSLAHTQLSDWESLSIGFLEALSQGCINIVWKDSAMAELLKHYDCGYLIGDNHNPHELAEIIKKLIASPEEAARLRLNAFEAAKHYTWSSVADSIEKFYGRLPAIN